MLTKIKSWRTAHGQAAMASARLFFRRPIAALMMLVVVAFVLTLPVLFWIFSDNVSQISAHWKKNHVISVYLKPLLADEAVQHTLQQVRATPGVANAVLTSAAEGLEELGAQEGMQDLMRSLAENPLPALIDVTPDFDVNALSARDSLVHQLQLMAHVEEVRLDTHYLDQVHALCLFATRFSFILLCLLACVVVFIISNTLRLMIQNQHEEIRVLQLIGATDSFIARPFLYSGVYYGLGGASLALGLVMLVMFRLNHVLIPLMDAFQMPFLDINISIGSILMLFVFSVILGWLGAYVSIKRQLAMIDAAI